MQANLGAARSTPAKDRRLASKSRASRIEANHKLKAPAAVDLDTSGLHEIKREEIRQEINGGRGVAQFLEQFLDTRRGGDRQSRINPGDRVSPHKINKIARRPLFAEKAFHGFLYSL